MANTIKHKKSATAGAVPLAEDLSPGELAINIADGKLFARKADGTVVELTRPTSIDGGEITYDSLLSDLQAFWLLDQVVGSVSDVSGNNRPLYVAAHAESGIGVQENSLSLSHKNFLYAAHDFPTRRTVAFWFKYSTPPAAPSPGKRFISFGLLGDTSANVGRVTLNQSGSLTWTENVADGVATVTTPTITANTWVHVAFVRESNPSNNTATTRAYINGVSVAVQNHADNAVLANQNDVLTLGWFNDSTRVELDCMGIWSRALSAAEVSRLHAGPYTLPPEPVTPIDPAAFISFSATAPITSLSISVNGSTGTLFPAFNANIYDYGVLTNSATAGAAVSYTLTVNGVATAGTGAVNNLIKVNYGSTAYYIRLLPSDMPLGTITTQPAQNYIPGYYVATSRRDINVANYNIVYNEHGLPIWYTTNAGTPHLHQPGNDRNRTTVSRNGSGTRYVMQTTAAEISTRAVSFLPTTRNGNPYAYDFGNHELLEITSPPSRRGNLVYNTFLAAPANGSQALTDKSYGVYIQEQTPAGTIAWEWWTSDRFDQTTLARNASFFHMNSVDVHPVTGDMLLSCRQCSAIVCVDHATKNVKWVIQGASQPWGDINQTANAATLSTAQFLTLEGEPTLNGYQYLGPEGQHHARWATHIDPLTPGNAVISIFDNQSGFFPGSTNTPKTVSALVQSGTTVTGTATGHGFATGSYVKVTGANETVFNGVFQVTVVNSSTFTYTVATSETQTASGTIQAVRALTYWPHSANSPAARGVVYEIDLQQNKAIHRCSAFAPNGTSGYLGSYQVMLHENGEYSHVLNFTQQHPPLVEYEDSGSGADPGNIIYAVDFPGDIYRITKVPKDYFDVEYLRATAGSSPAIIS